jgi:hypothetical protein
MPQINLDTNILNAAVETALEREGVIPKKDTAIAALDANSCDIYSLATYLANLCMTGKDSVRLKALQMAFAVHGIELNKVEVAHAAPVINFQIKTDGALNLNQLFAPER